MCIMAATYALCDGSNECAAAAAVAAVDRTSDVACEAIKHHSMLRMHAAQRLLDRPDMWRLTDGHNLAHA